MLGRDLRALGRGHLSIPAAKDRNANKPVVIVKAMQSCPKVVLSIAFASLASLPAMGCKKDESEPTIDASLVVVTSPAPNAVAPPVATFDQAPGNPNAVPTVTAPVQTVPVAAPGRPSMRERAFEAAQEGRSGEVRRLLEAKVRSGHGSADEVRLVLAACKSPFDKACIDDIKAKYP